MEAYEMTSEQMQPYAEHLRMEECSESTVRKYDNALAALYGWLPEDKSVTKELLLTWKNFYLSGWIAKAVRMEYAKRTSQERILIVEGR